MKYINILLVSVCVFLLAACTQDIEDSFVPGGDGAVRISLVPEGMNQVKTRAEGDVVEADSRIEHVAIYAFNASGNLVTSYEQDLEHPDREVSLILPQDKGQLTLHAVCNYTNMTAIRTKDDLDNIIVNITEADGAFNGSVVMHGVTTISEDEIANKTEPKTIAVKRLAAKIDFILRFDPEAVGDQFMLSRVTVHNIPMRSYLIERTGNVDHSVEGVNKGDEDWNYVYDSNNNESEDTSGCEDAAHADEKAYFDTYLLQTTGELDNNGEVKAQFYMFENRRGAQTDESFFTSVYTDKDDWQYLKGRVVEQDVTGKYQYATYIEIEGVYKFNGGSNMQATYKIYLGKNNYGDFNVFRNCHHTYDVTIRNCTQADSRVDVMNLNEAKITGSFNNPVDAHFNAVRCLGYTANGGWELYVKDPDLHPWLEISFSPQYRPRIAGQSYEDERMIASTRFVGDADEPLSQYFYIHTDEYIPENANADESLNDHEACRTGVIYLYDPINHSRDSIVVYQRPAQVVKMPIKNLLGHITGYNEYFVEYELEQKNITWGFLKYGANPVMTGMINDRWDGLSNTRKLYQEAVKIDESNLDYKGEDAGIYWGAYNGYLTVEDGPYPHLTEMEKIIDRIPDDHMIKYVLGKNRDRNGNGYIDYDEIVWYVPALDELAELWRVLDEKHIAFQKSGDRFHSSTPYLAGYTNDVPGRAFYVKNNGETGFAMRDRQYNVICCRRKGAWTGNNDAALGGNVTTDNEWKEDGDILPKQ